MAQISFPGQYPGGQYPGGRNRYPQGQPVPGQGPNQRGRGQQQPQTQSQTKDTRSNRNATPSITTTTDGILRRVTAGQIVIEPDDHRIVWYKVTTATTSQKDGKDADAQTFALGDYVSVDSTSDDEGNFTAQAITWRSEGNAKDRAHVAEKIGRAHV